MIDDLDPLEGSARRGSASSGSPWLSRLFSLVLAVVAALVLIGLLMPAISRPRGPSRGLQCASNLRQLGLGIAQYANQYDRFPPGTVPNPNLPIEKRLGWGFTILPYVDMVDYLPEKGSSQDAASALAWDDPVFADLGNGSPSLSRCPESLNRTGFLAIAGLGLDAPSLPTKHERAGIFGDDRLVRSADIKDGTSNTMMLVESDSAQGPWFAGGRATVRGLDPSRQPYIGPNRQFGGLHKGVASVLFADGSVKFLSESVDPKVFEALSTINGGEAVQADDL